MLADLTDVTLVSEDTDDPKALIRATRTFSGLCEFIYKLLSLSEAKCAKAKATDYLWMVRFSYFLLLKGAICLSVSDPFSHHQIAATVTFR